MDLRWWISYRAACPRHWTSWTRRQYWAVRHGLRNLRLYGPAVWQEDPCDWSYAVRLWERQFQTRADYFEVYGHHVGSEKEAAQLRLAAALCRRLLADRYFENARRTPWSAYEIPGRGRLWACRAIDQQEQDKRLLGHLIGRYLDHWWT